MAPPPVTTPPAPARSAAPAHSLRRSALIAGVGTLLLAVLSGWANFAVIEALVTEDDATRTARDILASETTFRLGILALFVAAGLDLVIAWALRAFFGPAHHRASTLAAWLRTAYAALFAIAITNLSGALQALNNTAPRTALPGEVPLEALRRIEAFPPDLGRRALLLFGLHLLLVGVLALRATYVPRTIGWLVLLAGGGYLFHSCTALIAPSALPEVALVTFVGEIVLMVWLLVHGRKAVSTDPATTSLPHA